MKVTSPHKMTAVAAVLLALLGGCKPATGTVDKTEHDPADQQADPEATRTALIEASVSSPKGLPASVTVNVTDEWNGHESSDEVLSSTAPYQQSVNYTSGRQLLIRVVVKPATSNAGALCKIIDGVNNVTVGPVNDSWRAVCELRTSQ